MKKTHGLLLILCLFVFTVSAVAVDGMEYSGENLRETPVVKAVRKTDPAVVNISTEKVVSVRGFNPFGDDWIFEYFRHHRRPQRNVKRQSLGSGVIINSDGVILTNEHVILPASKITVTMSDGREFEAELIGASRRFDLALLKVNSDEPLPFVPPAVSNDLMIGETVIAIGNPYGLSSTVTTGVLSARDRTITFQDKETNQVHTYYDFLQTDASINPGNSGGPLLNIYGELIGINTAIFAQAEGIGFAIPIDKAKRVIDDLLELGEVPRIWLGLQVQDLTDLLARHLGISEVSGILVSEVRADSPAQKAGLKSGDVIVRIGDKAVHNTLEYQTMIRQFTPGDEFEISVVRENKEFKKTMKAVAVPVDRVDELAWDLLGIQFRNITRKDLDRYGRYAPEGVLVTSVRTGSPAEDVGVKPGDILSRMNRTPIVNTEDLNQMIPLIVQQDSVVLVVVRGANAYRVTLTLQ